MSESQLQTIADNANMIVAGYSFTRDDNGNVRVLNLDNPEEACLLQQDGTMLETSMDDLTLLKIQSYYIKNREFMEGENA